MSEATPELDPGTLYRMSRESFDVALRHYKSEVRRVLTGTLATDFYVLGRVKSARSLIRKLREDPTNPRVWSSVTDKVGVRVICSTKADCRMADELLQDTGWSVVKHIVKSGRPDQLFYPGTHLIVADSAILDPTGSVVPCEIQIRTRAQDAWSVISHKLSYKGLVRPPRKMQRLIQRLTIVMEMFDDEVHRLFKKRAQLPMYRTAIALEFMEDKYEGLTGDVRGETSDLTMVQTLLRAYPGADLENFESIVGAYCDSSQSLAQLLEDHQPATEIYVDARDWLFSQPEILAVLERGTNKPYLLLDAITNTDLEDIVRRSCGAAGIFLPLAP